VPPAPNVYPNRQYPTLGPVPDPADPDDPARLLGQQDAEQIRVGVEWLLIRRWLKVPLRAAPGILAWTTPQPRLVNRIVVAPGVHFRQFPDGRILVGEDDGPPAGPTHAHLASGPQDFPADDFRALHGAQLLRMGSKYLPALADAEVHETTLGWRPMPKDGWPIVGFAESNRDVYVAVTHSGVTFGPLLGQLIATEILDGVAVELLSPYRLGRFA